MQKKIIIIGVIFFILSVCVAFFAGYHNAISAAENRYRQSISEYEQRFIDLGKDNAELGRIIAESAARNTDNQRRLEAIGNIIGECRTYTATNTGAIQRLRDQLQQLERAVRKIIEILEDTEHRNNSDGQ